LSANGGGGAQVVGHAVDRVDQVLDLVIGRDLDALVQVAQRDGVGQAGDLARPLLIEIAIQAAAAAASSSEHDDDADQEVAGGGVGLVARFVGRLQACWFVGHQVIDRYR
jgi:hypothetical protein